MSIEAPADILSGVSAGMPPEVPVNIPPGVSLEDHFEDFQDIPVSYEIPPRILLEISSEVLVIISLEPRRTTPWLLSQ